jgi:sirohydrochlorin cobaltochelatase
MVKKAILVVSFGTSRAETRKVTIEACEEKIRKNFPDYEIRRAFTSETIIKILKKRDHLEIDTPEEALQKLRENGYTEVIVQPLHIIPGFEFHDIVRTVKSYSASFEHLSLGLPLLSSSDDYIASVEALKGQFPERQAREAIVLMGHGTRHPANAAYAALERMFEERGCPDVLVGTVDAYPSLDDVIRRVRARGFEAVVLMPFLLVAGVHALHDMTSDEANSWKSRLTQAGFMVRTVLRGLGENPGIQDLYLQHVREAVTADNTSV